MRKMLPIIVDQVLLFNEKCTIWAMYPTKQVYIAAALHLIGIEFAIMHGKVEPSKRAKIVWDFTKNVKKCMVLICLYSVNSAGLNLQALYRNIYLFSPLTS